MGGGSYSYSASVSRGDVYKTKSSSEIFKQKSINNAMSPYGIKFRESRDSDEHPTSYPIIINLDVTGSMGSIPNYIVKTGLPNIMKKIMDAGIAHPQILFNAIGDHTCDDAPLQVGQFESSDELLDHWLTTVWLESGGGGNDGESYLLSWYFAGKHTSIDSFEKRNQKGVCITIGDEKTLKQVTSSDLKELMGPGQYDTATAAELLEQAEKLYHCYHIHITSTRAGGEKATQDHWKQLMGSNVIFLEDKEKIDQTIADLVIREYKNLSSSASGTISFTEIDATDASVIDDIKPEALLIGGKVS